MDMFDLENDLPDELMSSGNSWGMVSDPLGNIKPPAQGPGPGNLQNGVDAADGALRQQMQLNHHLLQQVLSLEVAIGVFLLKTIFFREIKVWWARRW